MLPGQVRVFVATQPVDFRGSFDLLAGVVRERLGADPRSGALFVFFNKRADRIKILFADGSGDCVFYKRLDAGTFRGIVDLDPAQSRVEVDSGRLRLLLSGAKGRPSRFLH
jgi:transposase